MSDVSTLATPPKNSSSTHLLSSTQREAVIGQMGRVFWLTGFSGAGKSTVANAFENFLNEHGYATYLLDGDIVRHGLCSDLGMSDADRKENVRRVGEVAKLMADAGLIVICALISPFRQGRDQVRNMLPPSRFFEIHIATPIEVCEQRDPKGLYKKARAGVLKSFTGLDSPYEPPLHPELVLGLGDEPLEAAVARMSALL
jgi:adenylylsulfate kinase